MFMIQKMSSHSAWIPHGCIQPTARRMGACGTVLGWVALALVGATVGCNPEPDPAAMAGQICDVQFKRAQMCPYEPARDSREACVAAYQCQTYVYGAKYARPFLDCAEVACKSKDGPELYEPCVKEKSEATWNLGEKNSTQQDFETACTAKAKVCAGTASDMVLTPTGCASTAGALTSAVLADLKVCLEGPCDAMEACFSSAMHKLPYCPDRK